MYQVKVNKTKYTFIVGDIFKYEGDVLYNWTTSNLITGDELFSRIHKEAGTVVYRDCQKALMTFGLKVNQGASPSEIAVGQTVISSAGLLPYKRILHCILPNYRIPAQQENKHSHLLNLLQYSFDVVTQLALTGFVKGLVLSPIPKKVYGLIDKQDIQAFVKHLLKYAPPNKIRKVTVIFATQEEYNLYVKELINQTGTWLDKLNYSFNSLFNNNDRQPNQEVHPGI